MACLKLQKEIQAASFPITPHPFASFFLQISFSSYGHQTSCIGIFQKLTNKLMAMWHTVTLTEKRQQKYKVTVTASVSKASNRR